MNRHYFTETTVYSNTPFPTREIKVEQDAEVPNLIRKIEKLEETFTPYPKTEVKSESYDANPFPTSKTEKRDEGALSYPTGKVRRQRGAIHHVFLTSKIEKEESVAFPTAEEEAEEEEETFEKMSFLKSMVHVRKEKPKTIDQDRPYECRICLKRFLSKSNLMTHLLIHIPQQIHACDICGKKFNRNGNLTRLYATL